MGQQEDGEHQVGRGGARVQERQSATAHPVARSRHTERQRGLHAARRGEPDREEERQPRPAGRLPGTQHRRSTHRDPERPGRRAGEVGDQPLAHGPAGDRADRQLPPPQTVGLPGGLQGQEAQEDGTYQPGPQGGPGEHPNQPAECQCRHHQDEVRQGRPHDHAHARREAARHRRLQDRHENWPHRHGHRDAEHKCRPDDLADHLSPARWPLTWGRFMTGTISMATVRLPG